MFISRVIMCSKLSWKLFKVHMQMLYGAWKVSKLPKPIVSIFGGARLSQKDTYAVQASELANMFVENNISVLTGGGPGIMEAANCGAIKQNGGKGKSMGIGVKELGEGKNPCVQEYIALDYFFARKWLLTRFSLGFVVFPGGFGTMDELAEVLTLIQTKKMAPLPIILIGTDYWDTFLKWVTDDAIKHGLIEKEHLELFTITDDLHQAMCLIRDTCEVPPVS